MKFDKVYQLATFNFEEVTSALFEFYFDIKKDVMQTLFNYAKYTPSEFREYFDSKFDLYEGKVEKIKITQLIDICKNILK